MPHVFISYAPENFEYAEEVKRRLEKAGLTIWADMTAPESVSEGKNWRQEIDDAIRGAFALVAVMTPQATAFDYMTYEWTFALGVGVNVIPLVFEPTDLPPRLRGLNAQDFAKRRRPWEQLLNLLKQIRNEYDFNRANQTPAGLEAITAAIRSSDTTDLGQAVAQIARMDDWNARETLVNIMRHPSQNIRTAAALALARAGDARATTTLMDGLLYGGAEVQMAALRALVDIKPGEILELVLSALKDDERRVQMIAKVVQEAIPRHVFLSYSRRDADVMTRLCDDMRDEQLTVWTDEALTPGDTIWQMEIEKAIESAGCVVVIFSPDAKKSQWVREELEYARTHNITIFPVLARGVEADSLPFGFTNVQFLDIRSEPKYQANAPLLVAHLQRYLRRLSIPDNK